MSETNTICKVHTMIYKCLEEAKQARKTMSNHQKHVFTLMCITWKNIAHQVRCRKLSSSEWLCVEWNSCGATTSMKRHKTRCSLQSQYVMLLLLNSNIWNFHSLALGRRFGISLREVGRVARLFRGFAIALLTEQSSGHAGRDAFDADQRVLLPSKLLEKTREWGKSGGLRFLSSSCRLRSVAFCVTSFATGSSSLRYTQHTQRILERPASSSTVASVNRA